MTPGLRMSPVPLEEVEISAIRAQGPGGQNVNKVASAVQLRFDISASSLPADCKQRLLALRDRRISRDGVLTIKAQRFRDREKNRLDALQRLQELIGRVARVPARRIPTRPSTGARERRLAEKQLRKRVKQTRARVKVEDPQ